MTTTGEPPAGESTLQHGSADPSTSPAGPGLPGASQAPPVVALPADQSAWLQRPRKFTGLAGVLAGAALWLMWEVATSLVFVPRLLYYAGALAVGVFVVVRLTRLGQRELGALGALGVFMFLANVSVRAIVDKSLGYRGPATPPNPLVLLAFVGTLSLALGLRAYLDPEGRRQLGATLGLSRPVDPVRASVALALAAAAVFAVGRAVTGPYEFGIARPATDPSVYAADVGDCLREYTDISIKNEVEKVNCRDPHLYEVFFVGAYEGNERQFPGDARLERYADRLCEREFEDYVGLEYEESIYQMLYVPPDREAWDNGVRDVACLIADPDAEDLIGSARDSRE